MAKKAGNRQQGGKLTGVPLIALLGCLVLWPQTAWNQVAAGSISGTVKDASGAVSPKVQITARNVDTGVSRTVQTDGTGHYLVTNLLPGNYEVRAELAGFDTEVRRGITLTLGREAVIDLTLNVGQVQQQVVVTGEAPLVDTTSAAVSALVDQQQVSDLPLDGRSLTQLAILQPGVFYYRDPSTTTGAGQNISINGARTRQVNFLLNGTSVLNWFGKSPSGTSGDQLGVDGIREFTVMTSSYSAEFGKSAGGVINAISKSGSNQFHGTLYEYLRNSDLDARSFFDPGSGPPPFKRNQFGGNLGGPIAKDKTFFFVNVESLRERLGLTLIDNTPTAAARQGILPRVAPISIAPAMLPYLALLPLPNGQDNGDGTGRYRFSFSQPTNEDYVNTRIDHNFSSSDSLFGSYVFDNSNRTTVNFTPDSLALSPYRAQYVSLEETHIFSAALLNVAHFGVNRSKTNQIPECSPADAALAFVPGPPTRCTNFQGNAGFTAPNQTLGPRIFLINSFQGSDTVSWNRGDHSFKLGGSMERIQNNGQEQSSPWGVYQTGSLQNFLTANMAYFEAPYPPTLDIQRGMRQNLFAFFGNDTIRLRSNLTVNLGIRYEFITVPTEVNGLLANIDCMTCFQRVGEPYFKNPSLHNFSPRVGMAWSPGGSQKTSVRAGFGIFQDELLHHQLLDAPFRTPPFWSAGRATSTAANPVPFPNAYDLFLAGRISNSPSFIFAVDGKPAQPYTLQYNFSVQRQLPGDVVIMAAYVGSGGRHLARVVDNVAYPTILPNGTIFFPTTSVRRNSNYQEVRFRTFDSTSSYNALQLQARRRFAHGIAFQGSYTWSKSLDMISDSQGSGDIINDTVFATLPEYPRIDKGRSAYDVRQLFVGNFTFDLPFGPGKLVGRNLGSIAGKVVGGWQGQGIVTLQSGMPTGAFLGFDNARTQSTRQSERPNLAPGCTAANAVLGPPDKTTNPQGAYLNPACFSLPAPGTLGNLGRNVFSGPGLATLDFSLIKNAPIWENLNLEFRAEVFNLLNRPNFGYPGQPTFPGTMTVFNTPGQTVPTGTFSTITSTLTSAREIQFALKLRF